MKPVLKEYKEKVYYKVRNSVYYNRIWGKRGKIQNKVCHEVWKRVSDEVYIKVFWKVKEKLRNKVWSKVQYIE